MGERGVSWAVGLVWGFEPLAFRGCKLGFPLRHQTEGLQTTNSGEAEQKGGRLSYRKLGLTLEGNSNLPMLAVKSTH